MMTTFPFLKIARDHGVSYGAVIRLAELCWNSRSDPGIVIYNPVLFEVWDAVKDEQARRKAPHMIDPLQLYSQPGA
jgi:hypothetical protein